MRSASPKTSDLIQGKINRWPSAFKRATSVTAWVFLWSDSSYFHSNYQLLFSVPAHAQWWGIYQPGLLNVLWVTLCIKTPSCLRTSLLSFNFFVVCALSKLAMHCHHYIAFNLCYCFNQSSRLWQDMLHIIIALRSRIESEDLSTRQWNMFILFSKYVLGIFKEL